MEGKFSDGAANDPQDQGRLNRFSIRLSDHARAFIGTFHGHSNGWLTPKRKKIAIAVAVAFVLGTLTVILVPLYHSKRLPSETRSTQVSSMSPISLWYTQTIGGGSTQIVPSGSIQVLASSGSHSSKDSSHIDLESSRDTSWITVIGPPVVAAPTTTPSTPESPQTHGLSVSPSIKETASAAAVASFLPSMTSVNPPQRSSDSPQTSADPPQTTSLLFGATGPVKTYLWDGTTTVCTRWSGLGCPGDQCYSNTCLDPLPCWEGVCCTSGCAEGWECTGTCVSEMLCVTATGDSTGACRYTS